MYAIVDVAGQQFKVEKDQKIFVHRLEGNEGDRVEFDRVLLIDNGDKVLIGEPVIEGAMVSGKIIYHLKGDKINVFKKKRRKGYEVSRGHRQLLSQVLIEKITEKGAKKKETVKEEKPEPKMKAEVKSKDKTIAPKADQIPGKKTTRTKRAGKVGDTKAKSADKPADKKPAGPKKAAAKKSDAKPKTGVKTASPKTRSKATTGKTDSGKKNVVKKTTPKKTGTKEDSA
ncbi:MAG: 50S ribosomal protein L21 [Bacteroidales bacterium]|nr:MAG: 50S ribosomal protein L21 [Bacteroidales bacterium]